MKYGIAPVGQPWGPSAEFCEWLEGPDVEKTKRYAQSKERRELLKQNSIKRPTTRAGREAQKGLQ